MEGIRVAIVVRRGGKVEIRTRGQHLTLGDTKLILGLLILLAHELLSMKVLLLQTLIEALILILQILNLLTQRLFRTHLGIELSHEASVDGNEMKIKMSENESGKFLL